MILVSNYTIIQVREKPTNTVFLDMDSYSEKHLKDIVIL